MIRARISYIESRVLRGVRSLAAQIYRRIGLPHVGASASWRTVPAGGVVPRIARDEDWDVGM